eukprot:jgi/Bigna1/83434/fgenesh1_pg.108_\
MPVETTARLGCDTEKTSCPPVQLIAMITMHIQYVDVDRYFVTVDLMAKAFEMRSEEERMKKGKNEKSHHQQQGQVSDDAGDDNDDLLFGERYTRVKWCLGRMAPADFTLSMWSRCCTDLNSDDGVANPETKSTSALIQVESIFKEKLGGKFGRVDMRTKLFSVEAKWLPPFSSMSAKWPQNKQDADRIVDAILESFGYLTLGMSPLRHELPAGFSMERADDCRSSTGNQHRVHVMTTSKVALHPGYIKDVSEKLKKMVDDERLPWGALYVSGVQHSPHSWSEKERGSASGEHNALIIILPKGYIISVPFSAPHAPKHASTIIMERFGRSMLISTLCSVQCDCGSDTIEAWPSVPENFQNRAKLQNLTQTYLISSKDGIHSLGALTTASGVASHSHAANE